MLILNLICQKNISTKIKRANSMFLDLEIFDFTRDILINLAFISVGFNFVNF